jgi:ankyrin repeat protein
MVLVPMLLKAGANVNARDSRGFTPLHSAARCDFRLSYDDCTSAGRNGFDERWKQGAKPVITYLLEHGADVAARTNTGQSVLDIFVTPCDKEPELCNPQTIDSAKWPAGYCKAAYLLVKGKMAETH